jgi:hypothetical protein
MMSKKFEAIKSIVEDNVERARDTARSAREEVDAKVAAGASLYEVMNLHDFAVAFNAEVEAGLWEQVQERIEKVEAEVGADAEVAEGVRAGIPADIAIDGIAPQAFAVEGARLLEELTGLREELVRQALVGRAGLWDGPADPHYAEYLKERWVMPGGGEINQLIRIVAGMIEAEEKAAA